VVRSELGAVDQQQAAAFATLDRKPGVVLGV